MAVFEDLSISELLAYPREILSRPAARALDRVLEQRADELFNPPAITHRGQGDQFDERLVQDFDEWFTENVNNKSRLEMRNDGHWGSFLEKEMHPQRQLSEAIACVLMARMKVSHRLSDTAVDAFLFFSGEWLVTDTANWISSSFVLTNRLAFAMIEVPCFCLTRFRRSSIISYYLHLFSQPCRVDVCRNHCQTFLRKEKQCPQCGEFRYNSHVRENSSKCFLAFILTSHLQKKPWKSVYYISPMKLLIARLQRCAQWREWIFADRDQLQSQREGEIGSELFS
jgi:hypothetical protein